ncbi:MAG: PIN domain-containing protein [Clostridiales Family XIII bacterium]|jgi:predicted nucleic-acid-binding protein|nr:PIN domain-containing protein [Clostridiales Family XIII bacterium]
MHIVDANIILRYILADDANLAKQAQNIIESGTFDVPTEVLAEVVFVLQKVYSVPRDEISKLLRGFASDTDAVFINEDAMLRALDFYAATNFDFVDCALVAYHDSAKAQIHTFDKKLVNFIARLDNTDADKKLP